MCKRQLSDEAIGALVPICPTSQAHSEDSLLLGDAVLP